LSNKSGSIKERTKTSSEMGRGCQRNGHRQRLIICQVVACAANQEVVVCGRWCAGRAQWRREPGEAKGGIRAGRRCAGGGRHLEGQKYGIWNLAAVSLVLTHSARQQAASSTDCDPDRLVSMISLCYSALNTSIALFLMR